MQYLKKFIFIIQIVITTLLTLVLSNYFLYYDEDLLMAKMIFKHPEVFEMSDLKRGEIVTLMQNYRNMNNNNYKTFEYGDTYESSKKACIEKILELTRRTIANGETLYSNKGYAPINIGGATNPFLANAVNIEKLSDIEAELYMSNIGKILNAIPKNIPDKKTLTKFKISEVRFLDKFAKVTFVEDVQAEKLAREGKIYKGQF